MNTILAIVTVVSGGSLVAILINILILLLILSLIYYVITLLPLPPIFRNVAQIVLAIVVIIYLASLLTGCTPGSYSATTPWGAGTIVVPSPTPSAFSK